MSLLRRALAATAALTAPMALAALPASAAPTPGAVYVLGNQAAGNTVLAFARAADGSLVPAGSFATGGLGAGSGLGSQGALVLDESSRHLYAVNAGSDSISSFRVRPDGLQLVDTVASGGVRPISITVHHGVVYVLNAGGNGNISGFTSANGDLEPIAGSTQPLSGTDVGPAQVQFSHAGDHLVVTEKATNRLDVYSVDESGVAGAPNVVASSGATPFGFAIDRQDHVIVSEAFGGAADASAVSSYTLDGDDLDSVSASVPTTETAACWIALSGNGKFAYAGNAGTASVTGYRVGNDGALTVLDADGKTASAPAGVTDLDVSTGSQFLFGRLGDGSVAAWPIGADGSLGEIHTIGGLPASAVGIAAR
jgi:6-phosphogluconolactonase (cycloisomerase 2 family)